MKMVDSIKTKRRDEPVVVYITPEWKINLIMEEDAMGMLTHFIDKMTVESMGKTGYILCAFRRNTVRIEGDTYLFPEFLIMKKMDNKVEALSSEETDSALNEFASRLVDLRLGEIKLPAYGAD